MMFGGLDQLLVTLRRWPELKYRHYFSAAGSTIARHSANSYETDFNTHYGGAANKPYLYCQKPYLTDRLNIKHLCKSFLIYPDISREKEKLREYWIFIEILSQRLKGHF